MQVTTTHTVQHDYVTQSGRLVREKVTEDGTLTAVMDFVYDESGRPLALLYSTNGTDFTTYYYILNLQGDVVKLIGTDGTVAASYTYDAWGNILLSSGTMAEKNPLRYRGYYYDSETGYYYLQSRYYDPTTRRFLNADSLVSTGQGFTGTNKFAYCGNNPIRYQDATGNIRTTSVPMTDGMNSFVRVSGEEYIGEFQAYHTRSYGKEFNIVDNSQSQYGEKILEVEITKGTYTVSKAYRNHKKAGTVAGAVALAGEIYIHFASNANVWVAAVCHVASAASTTTQFYFHKDMEPGNYITYTIAVFKKQADYSDGRPDAPYISSATVVNVHKFYFREPEMNNGEPLIVYVEEYERSVSD